MAIPKPKGIDKKIAKVLELVGEGQSVRKACESAEIARTTFHHNVDADQYARAREDCADVHFDEILDLIDKVGFGKGKINPQAAKVILEGKKWVLGKMKPKAYGDKIEVNGSLDLVVAINEGRKRAAGK